MRSVTSSLRELWGDHVVYTAWMPPPPSISSSSSTPGALWITLVPRCALPPHPPLWLSHLPCRCCGPLSAVFVIWRRFFFRQTSLPFTTPRVISMGLAILASPPHLPGGVASAVFVPSLIATLSISSFPWPYGSVCCLGRQCCGGSGVPLPATAILPLRVIDARHHPAPHGQDASSARPF